MSYISVDIEADGPIPGEYSMISFGAVIVEPSLSKTFYAEIKPISDNWQPDALAISGFTREQTLKFKSALDVMYEFDSWVKTNSPGQAIFIADNNGFDFAFINWYFHKFVGKNPFGWSSRRIGDLYCGFVNDTYAKWKHLRTVKHTHNALDDAMGNATALLKMKELGLNIKLK